MAYRSSTQGAVSNSGTISTNRPAGLANGDICTLILFGDNYYGTPTWPTGFIEEGSAFVDYEGGNRPKWMWVAKKVITDAGSEASTYSVSHSGDAWMQAFAHSGRNGAAAMKIATLTLVNTQSGSPRTLSLTGLTAAGGDDVMWAVSLDPSATGPVTGFTAPSGFTSRQSFLDWYYASNVSTRDNVAAGATGAISGQATFPSGTTGYLGVVLALAAGSSAPTISAGTPQSNTTSTVSSTVETDADSGTLFTVASTSATAPTGPQIEAGEMHTGADAAGFESQVVTEDGEQNISVSGLPQGTTLYLHHVHKVGSDYSNIATSAAVQTRGIGSVDTDNIVVEGQTSVQIAGRFGAATPVVRIKSGGVSAVQSVTANTTSQITISPIARGNLPYSDINHTHLLEVDTDE